MTHVPQLLRLAIFGGGAAVMENSVGGLLFHRLSLLGWGGSGFEGCVRPDPHIVRVRLNLFTSVCATTT